jgi:hypothetical protein
MKKLIKIQNELKVPKTVHTPEYYACEDGFVYSFRYDKYRKLKPQLKKNGYYSICMHNKTFSLHRLIAKSFIENKENKPEVNHIDGNKLNNVPSNLQWCTASENQKHAFENGLQKLRYNKDIYTFQNIITKEIFNCSVYELRKKHNLNHQHFSKLLKGEIKTLHKFKII